MFLANILIIIHNLYCRGAGRGNPFGSAADDRIIYLIKQKDLISDKIPVIGIADDLGVMALALKLCEPELTAFSEWRATKDGVPG